MQLLTIVYINSEKYAVFADYTRKKTVISEFIGDIAGGDYTLLPIDAHTAKFVYNIVMYHNSLKSDVFSVP